MTMIPASHAPRVQGTLGAVVLAAFAAVSAALTPAGAASAPAYPGKLVKIIAPYTAGSPNDVMARLLAQSLQTSLGQPIVVENRPGGGTSIGTKAVAAANPDGYTLLFVSSSLVIDPAMNRKLDYDPRKDFAPVATVMTTPWLLVVAPDLPARSVREFVAYAKAHPGELRFGFAQGTASQLVGEQFKILTGTDIVSVPYKGGAAAVPDFLGGRIHVLVPTPATTMALIREGRMRPLAITSATRSADLPEVPTMIESGLPALTLDFWAGMLAPAGTPADIVDRLNTAINDSLRSPEMKTSMTKLGFEAKIGSPADFAALIASELPRWAEIVKSSGMKVE